jgi:hypothetical protein
MYTSSFVCVPGYYEAGCWLDGVTDNPMPLSKNTWYWSTSGNSSNFLRSAEAASFWTSGTKVGIEYLTKRAGKPL